MWTDENRARYDRSRLRYPSDLTDGEWALIAPLIPPAKRGGNKRTVNLREIVNGLMYILSTGCQWRAISKDLPPRSTLHDYLDLWSWDGTLDRIHYALYVECRERAGCEASPTAAIIDSQSVKSTERGLASIRTAMMRARRSTADDEIGRLNLITPERRLAAMAEVKEGHAFCLSLPLDLPGGNVLVEQRHPPVRGVEPMDGGQRHLTNYPMGQINPHWVDFVWDDYVKLYTQYSTQWDSLSHIGRMFDADGTGTQSVTYYHGYRAGIDVLGPEHQDGPAARRLRIEKMAETCVQGRGVLIDLFTHFGSEGKAVGYDDLQRVMAADGVTVEAGDMLCIHTGYGQAVMDMAGKPDPEILHRRYAALDGRDHRLCRWIDESQISVLIADNFGVEAFPYADLGESDRYPGLPIHQKCLFELGIHLGELWYLGALATHLRHRKRSRFLLTAPPLRLPGSFGSPATPVATV